MNFTNFTMWRAAAKTQGYHVKLVTRGKKNSYYQALHEGSVVGFFNTGLKGGRLS